MQDYSWQGQKGIESLTEKGMFCYITRSNAARHQHNTILTIKLYFTGATFLSMYMVLHWVLLTGLCTYQSINNYILQQSDISYDVWFLPYTIKINTSDPFFFIAIETTWTSREVSQLSICTHAPPKKTSYT